MTLPYNLEVENAVIGATAFFILAFIVGWPIKGSIIVLAYLKAMSLANGYGPPGWLLHMIHYLQVGVRLHGFCIPKTITYDVW